MNKFIKDNRGAVTVFVTLILIPAILVSGLAVDISRIIVANSILQDANQLAANSVLTKYDALLQDIYGLFGIDGKNSFSNLVNEYVNTTIYGEDVNDLKPIHLFYDSSLDNSTISFVESKSLRDVDTLKRQIEEFMKYRGPIVIVEDILDMFKENNSKDEIEIVETKSEIDNKVAKLYELYLKLYGELIITDNFDSYVSGSGYFIKGDYKVNDLGFKYINKIINFVRDRFKELENCYNDWNNASEEDKRKYEEYYEAILECIIAYVEGSSLHNYKTGSHWKYGEIDESKDPPEWKEGKWSKPDEIKDGLIIAKKYSISYIKEFRDDGYKNLEEISKQIDNLRLEINSKIDELEEKLNSDDCDSQLRKSLLEDKDEKGKSVIDNYREVIKYNVTAMTEPYIKEAKKHINNDVIPFFEDIGYKSKNSNLSFTLEELQNMKNNKDFVLPTCDISMIEELASFTDNDLDYHMPDGYKKFKDNENNKEFYDLLYRMANGKVQEFPETYKGQENVTGKDDEEKQRNVIKNLLKIIEDAFNNALKNEQLGASKIEDAQKANDKKLNILDIAKMLPTALSDPIVQIVKDPLASLEQSGDYLLLLSYVTEMFSNYITMRPYDDNQNTEYIKTLTGVPMSTEVNYFFQSEWEYLFNGSKNADNNLNAITRQIFLIRFVYNYITVFSIDEINQTVLAIKGAFSWNPTLAIILGELARAAFVASETIIDLGALREGYRVSMTKNAQNWICKPSTVLYELTKLNNKGSVEELYKKYYTKGLSYSNYMMIFFISKAVFYIGNENDAATELTKRTADLIEWNIVNYKNNIGEEKNADKRESKMKEALNKNDRFKLSNMKTDFTIESKINIRMLFLSMPFSQSGVKGVIPPKTYPIYVKDYRGY